MIYFTAVCYDGNELIVVHVAAKSPSAAITELQTCELDINGLFEGKLDNLFPGIETYPIEDLKEI